MVCYFIPQRVPHLIFKKFRGPQSLICNKLLSGGRNVLYLFYMRTPRQSKKDAHAWPVTLRVIVPNGGFHSLGSKHDVHRWLMQEVGRGEFATSPHRSVIGDVFEIHVRTVEIAQRFREAFPMLRLADETESLLWSSPDHPNGRN